MRSRHILWSAMLLSCGAPEGAGTASTDSGTGGAASAGGAEGGAGGALEAGGQSSGGAAGHSSGSAGGEPSGGAGGGQAGCQPVRHYVFPLNQTLSLACVPGNEPTLVFDQVVPDQGHTLVRLNLNLFGAGASEAGVHGWSSSLEVGDPTFPERINFAAGEDLCPGEQLTRRMLGYGDLSASNDRITVTMSQYRSSDCQNGVVNVAADSALEVWVEDPQPECRNRSIVAESYFKHIWELYGDGTSMPLSLDTSFSEVLTASLELDQPSNLQVLSQLEMSPAATSNQCGNRFETGVAAITQSGSYLSTEVGGYPPSGGQTHLLLSPEFVQTNAGPGLVEFGIAAAVNQSAQAGALVGATFSGDTVLAIVVVP